jgi:hypothetical protein
MIHYSSTQYETRRFLRSMTKIGNIGVDSGAVLISDPCYVLRQDGQQENSPSYGDFLAAADEHRENGYFSHISFNDGVITETTYGDGVYPVYARFDRYGRITQVIIDFEQMLEEDDDFTVDPIDNDPFGNDPTFDELEEECLERDVPDDLAS